MVGDGVSEAAVVKGDALPWLNLRASVKPGGPGMGVGKGVADGDFPGASC